MIPFLFFQSDFILLWRLHSQQVFDEIIPPYADEVGVVGEAVPPVGDDQKVEVLVGLDQFSGQPQAAGRIDVVVHIPVNQQQLALQIAGKREVRLFVVMRPIRKPHPELGPPGFGHPKVMIPRRRDSDFVEFRMCQQRVGCVVAARRMSVNAHSGQIHVGITLGHPSHCYDMILSADISQVLVGEIVEFFGSHGCSQPVNGDNDESQLSDGLV